MNAAIDVEPDLLREHPCPRIDGKTDKDSRGRVFMVAGSAFCPGAALLSGEAALRGGAGKVLLGTPRSIAMAAGLAAPEFGILALAETEEGEPAADDPGLATGAESSDVIVLGPGLMSEDNALRLARRFLTTTRVPLLLDAAAITAFAGHAAELRGRRCVQILTPHPGEMAKLMGITREAVEGALQATCAQAAAEFASIVVLKSADTFIGLPDGPTYRHRGGVPGLATAGSGDTLAGLMAGLLARGATPLSACLWSVFIHAQAGALLSERIGAVGFLARQLAPEFPGLLQKFAPP